MKRFFGRNFSLALMKWLIWYIIQGVENMISHRLIVGNYVVEMRKLETGSIDLILTDPTFNIGKEYGGVCKNNMEFNDYIDWCKT